MVRGTLRKKYHLGADVLLIGFIGVIVQWKGIHVFLDAIQQLQEEVHRPARFFVIGDSWNQTDPYKQSLLARVEAAGLNHLVHFTGRLSNIPELLADLDLVVHASIEPDPFPNVILEAMAMRKLIIASNCGGVPEMLDHGVTGFLYPPGDVGALRGLLSRCIHEYENLTAHRECARRTVEEYFTEESQWAALLGIYHGLVRSSSQVGTR
jgi:glycosyltransferase involved in cell wall biosynthesis